MNLTKEIITNVCTLGITTVTGYVAYYIKKFISSKRQVLEATNEQIKQTIGQKNYESDVALAKTIISSIEAQGKQFNWDGAIKHSKATQAIVARTTLNEDDVYDIIKSVVDTFKKDVANTK